MHNQYKGSRYSRRSRSSSSHRDHYRDRRPYDKERSERQYKYHRRSRSRTPPRDHPHKSKYHQQPQQREEKRYLEGRNEERSKYHEMGYNRRDQGDKRQREKADQYPLKLKYNRHQQKEPKYREREQHFQKRGRGEDRDQRDYKEYRHRKSSPSRSRSSSRRKTEGKTSLRRRSPQRQKEQTKRYRRGNESGGDDYRKVEQEKHRVSPPKANKQQSNRFPYFNSHPMAAKQLNERHSPNNQKNIFEREKMEEQNKPVFRLKHFPPPPQPTPPKPQQKQPQPIKPERPSFTVEPLAIQAPSLEQVRQQIKQEEAVPAKVKANKFDLLVTYALKQMQQARHNLSVGPPKSSFLLLDTFRTMNKFQVEMLEPKWMAFLKRDMEGYPEERQELFGKLSEASASEELRMGQQYMWMKDQRNEDELDLRFRLEQFKQHNANLSEMVRKIRFLD